MPSARRLPPPWTLDKVNDACFIVRDKNGQALTSKTKDLLTVWGCPSFPKSHLGSAWEA
jgi:hypothetical protein